MALRRGSLEIRIRPFRGEYNSRVRKIAPETALAQTKSKDCNRIARSEEAEADERHAKPGSDYEHRNSS